LLYVLSKYFTIINYSQNSFACRYRGISDDELSAFPGEKDVSEEHWKSVIGFTDKAQDKEAFRIFETSVLEIT